MSDSPTLAAMAKAMWRKDGEMNGHDGVWSHADERHRTLFLEYARAAARITDEAPRTVFDTKRVREGGA